MASKGSSFSFSGFRQGGKGMIFIFCFLVAACIWFINSLSKTHVTTYTYFITPHDKNKEAIKVTGTFSGQGFSLFRLYYRLNGKHIELGMFNTVVDCKVFTDSMIGNLRNDVHLVNVDPSIITEAIADHQTVKRVPLKNMIKLSLNREYGLSVPVMFKPDSIDIAGPADVVDTIKSIATEEVKYDHLSEPLFRSVKLVTPLPSVWLSQQKVWMYVSVEKFTEAQIEVPVSIKPVNSHIKPVPAKTVITCQVPLSKYNALKPEDFNVEANVPANTNKKEYSLRLLQRPRFVRNVTLSPDEVSVLIFE